MATKKIRERPAPIDALMSMIDVAIDPQSIPSIDDELRGESPAGMRRLLLEISRELTFIADVHQVHPVHPVHRAQLGWLAEALAAVGGGENANVALGLTRRVEYGPRAISVAAYRVERRRELGYNKDEAIDCVARFRSRGLRFWLAPEGSDGAEALKGLLKRRLRGGGKRSSTAESRDTKQPQVSLPKSEAN